MSVVQAACLLNSNFNRLNHLISFTLNPFLREPKSLFLDNLTLSNTMNKPTGNNPNNNRRLKVIPPNQKQPPQNQTPPPPKQPPKPPTPNNPEPEPSSSFPWARLLVFAGFCAGIYGVLQIPIADQFTAEALVKVQEGETHLVSMEVSGTITELHVEKGDTVQPQQIIATIESEGLEDEITDLEMRSQEQNFNVEVTKQQAKVAQAKVLQIQQQENIVRQRVLELEQDVANIDDLPEVRAKQSQVDSFKARLASIQESLEQFASLNKLGGETRLSGVVIEHEKIKQFERDMASVQGEIWSIEAQIESIKKQKLDEVRNKKEELEKIQTSYEYAKAEFEQAKAKINSHFPLLEQYNTQKYKVEQQKKETQLLKSPHGGKVITDELYKRKGRFVEKGEAVLEIADLDKLNAEIKVESKNAHLVKPDLKVILNADGLDQPIETTIDKVEDTNELKEEENKTFTIANATISPKSVNDQLKPDAMLNATIKTGTKISLYEKIKREIQAALDFI